MFSSWFKSPTKSTPAVPSLPLPASARRNARKEPTEDEDGGYAEVTFAGGEGRQRQNQASSSLATTSSSTPSSSYPPLASNSTLISFPPSSSSSTSFRSNASTGYPPLRTTFDRLSSLLLSLAPTLRDSLSPALSPTSLTLSNFITLLAAHDLILPPAVVESYALHNGQDPFSSSTTSASSEQDGLVYGLWWMNLEEVVAEWKIWRAFEARGGRSGMKDAFTLGDSPTLEQDRRENNGMRRGVQGEKGKGRAQEEEEEEEEEQNSFYDEEEEYERERRNAWERQGMSSCPFGWVRHHYSHPGWIPLLTDRAGNYIGVDLDPPTPMAKRKDSSSTQTNGLFGSHSGVTTQQEEEEENADAVDEGEEESRGQAGQVIAFGREIDEKVVLFPGHSQGGWGRFLSSFVDDLERGQFSKLKSTRRRSPTSSLKGSDGEGESWEDGDGLGDRGYLEGARYGDEEEGEEEGGDGRVWTLRSEWRRWIADHDDQGGIIGALAERSRRKWKEMGIGLPRQTTNRRPPTLSVVVPVLHPHDVNVEAGPDSSSTERPNSPRLIRLTSPSPPPIPNESGSEVPPCSPGSMSVSLVLSPPSPKTTLVELPPTSIASPATPDTPDRSSLVAPPSNSPRKLHRRAQQAHAEESAQQRRRRPPPPVACALDLPTMSDIDDFVAEEQLARMPSPLSTNNTSKRHYQNSDLVTTASPSSPSSPRRSLHERVRDIIVAPVSSTLKGVELLSLSMPNSRTSSSTNLVEQEERGLGIENSTLQGNGVGTYVTI